MTKAIDSLVNNDFTIPQAKAIIAKLKEQWKEVKTWSAPQLKKVGKLLKDFSVEDLKSLSKDQFQVCWAIFYRCIFPIILIMSPQVEKRFIF